MQQITADLPDTLLLSYLIYKDYAYPQAKIGALVSSRGDYTS